MHGKPWTDRERELIWPVYLSLRMGQFHARHPEVADIARTLSRTPASVATKLCNLYWFDSNGQKGLRHGSREDARFVERKNQMGERHPGIVG